MLNHLHTGLVRPDRSEPERRVSTVGRPKAAHSSPACGRLTAASRAGVAVLLVLALANGVFLYLLPGHAQSHYAWPIAPPISAAFLGAGYLAGTVATALVVFRAELWRSLRILALPLVVLSLVLLAATLLHADRFRWDYPPTWLWTVVYAVVPGIVAMLWRVQERDAAAAPAADPRIRRLRGRSAALGTALMVGGLAVLVAPSRLGDIWPWQLTPLLARAFAAWYLLVGSALITAAVSLRRVHEVHIPYTTLLTWSTLLVVLPILHAEELLDRPLAIGGWLTVHALLIGLALSALRRSVPVLRSGEERL
jgi:hypothetical protein